MPSKNIILISLKESVKSIWENKALFLLLFVLQITFFVALSFINIAYQTKIVENAQAITDYLSKQKLDDASVASNMLQQKSILGDDPLLIGRHFNEILKNFRLYIAYLFLLSISSASIIWALASSLVHKLDFRSLAKAVFRNFIVSLFYLGLIFSFLYSLLNFSFAELATDSGKFFMKYMLFLAFSAILYYFMFVSLSLACRTGLKNIVQKALAVGVKKIHYISAVFLVNIILALLPALSLYYFLEKSTFAVLLSAIFIIFSFVFGRIFLINVASRVE